MSLYSAAAACSGAGAGEGRGHCHRDTWPPEHVFGARQGTILSYPAKAWARARPVNFTWRQLQLPSPGCACQRLITCEISLACSCSLELTHCLVFNVAHVHCLERSTCTLPDNFSTLTLCSCKVSQASQAGYLLLMIHWVMVLQPLSLTMYM